MIAHRFGVRKRTTIWYRTKIGVEAWPSYGGVAHGIVQRGHPRGWKDALRANHRPSVPDRSGIPVR